MDKKAQQEPLFNSTSGQDPSITGRCQLDNTMKEKPVLDDSFYETIDRSAEYDNEINNSTTGAGGAAVAGPTLSDEELERQQEEQRKELAKLEEEITTLRSVLSTKQREAAHIKMQLGITPMTEMKADLRTGLSNIKESETVVKTTEALHQIEEAVINSHTVKKTSEALNKLEESITQSGAYQKTGMAFKSLGSWSSKKLGDVRNSNTFKSFEEKMGGAYSSVRSKIVTSPAEDGSVAESRMTGSQSEDNFDDAVRAHRENGNVAASGDSTTPTAEKMPL